MHHDLNPQEIFAIAENNHLRSQAMDLYERCLTEGKPDYLLRFIELQLLCDPPPLELLYDLMQDLHQRWLTLREHLFDVRNRLLSTLWSVYQIDLNSLSVAHSLDEYHLIDPDQLIASIAHHCPSLSGHDLQRVRKEIVTSLSVGYQLYGDTMMTIQMMKFIQDWAAGLGIDEIRRAWTSGFEESSSTTIQ
jgi:hypothetical protein